MNKTVTATGMQVKAVSSSSLVIAKTLGGTGVGTETTVTFDTAVAELIPASHISDGGTYSGSNSTNLYYNTNPGAVSAASGYAADSTTAPLTFAYAANKAATTTDPAENYYVDYVVYIAAAGAQMANQDLKVKLFMSSATYASLADTTKAITVDFYVADEAVTSGFVATSGASDYLGTFAGKLNLSSLSEVAASSTYETAELNLAASGIAIPQNKSTTDYLRVTMRVYFDGNLQKATGQAYVYSDAVSTANITFSASFTASEHPTA